MKKIVIERILMMKYEKQIELIANHLQNSETPESEYRIGIEIEHLIVHKNDLSNVSYFEENGIEDILVELSKKGWNPKYEEELMIFLEKEKIYITLEPGGQIEVSIVPEKQLAPIVDIYKNFLKDIIPILDEND